MTEGDIVGRAVEAVIYEAAVQHRAPRAQHRRNGHGVRTRVASLQMQLAVRSVASTCQSLQPYFKLEDLS